LGFVGVMIAVPVAAIIGVMVRFCLDRYKDSSYYTGIEQLRTPKAKTVKAKKPKKKTVSKAKTMDKNLSLKEEKPKKKKASKQVLMADTND